MNLSRKNCCLGHNERLCKECWNVLSQPRIPLPCLFHFSAQRREMILIWKKKLFVCQNCAMIFNFFQQIEAKAHLESCRFENLEEPNFLPTYTDEINRTPQNMLNWNVELFGYKEKFAKNRYAILQKTINYIKWRNSRWRRSFGTSNIYNRFLFHLF